MGLLSLFLLSLPFAVKGELLRRDDSSEGGGDPEGGNEPDGLDFSNWVGQPGVKPIQPSKDHWFNTKLTNLTLYNNGQVIDHRSVGLSGTYQGVSKAYQLRVRSENAHEAPALTFATVLVPQSSQFNGQVVAYQVAVDAINMDCAPSYRLFDRSAVPEIQSLLSEGYAVVVPDYEGQRGSFTVGKLAGRQILDSVRAALTIPDLQNGKPVNVGLWGYGTASHATGWAAELAASYAPELPIKGVALGGVISSLLSWVDNIDGTPSAGNIVTSLLGMASEYKDISDFLTSNLQPRRRNEFQWAQNHCYAPVALRFYDQNVTADFFTTGTNIFLDPKVKNVYEINSLGHAAPKAGVFVYQGTEDDISSDDDVFALMKNYCSSGTTVKYHPIEGASHSQARAVYDDVLDYLSDVLVSGEMPNSSCQRIQNGGYQI